jgi:hypothetical protein
MEPKDYATIRAILKQEQGEKIAPYVFKLTATDTLEKYLKREKITYEIYQQQLPSTLSPIRQISKLKRPFSEPETFESRKKRRFEE